MTDDARYKVMERYSVGWTDMRGLLLADSLPSSVDVRHASGNYKALTYPSGVVRWKRETVSGSRVVWRTISVAEVPAEVQLEARLISGA